MAVKRRRNPSPHRETIVDTAKEEWQWLKDQVPPPNVQALDQEAYDLMVEAYSYNIVLTGPDVNRWADPK